MWCLKVRRTAPSLTLKSLTVLSNEPSRRARAGCRAAPRGRYTTRAGVQLSEGVLEGAVEEPHADGVVQPAAEDALAVGHRRHRPSRQSACPTQVLTRLLVATLHTLTRPPRCHGAPLMMCWPSGVTASATKAGVPLEGVDERAVDVVQPDLVDGRQSPTTKCTPSGSAATQSTVLSTSKGALESAVERPQLRVQRRSAAVLTKRVPPGSTATPTKNTQFTTWPCVRVDGALAHVAAPHLDGVVVRAGDDAAVAGTVASAAHRHAAVGPEVPSVTTSPEKGAPLHCGLRAQRRRVCGTSAPRRSDVVGER